MEEKTYPLEIQPTNALPTIENPDVEKVRQELLRSERVQRNDALKEVIEKSIAANAAAYNRYLATKPKLSDLQFKYPEELCVEGTSDPDPGAISAMSRTEQEKLLLSMMTMRRMQCESYYKVFFRDAWDIIEPGTSLIENWHIDLVADELQQVIERAAYRLPRKYHLLINLPPRNAKSTLATKSLQPWAWIRWPFLKLISGSYASDLAVEHARMSRSLMESEWYRSNWGNKFKMASDMNLKSWYENNFYGYRMTTSRSSIGTGRGGDIIIIDDPISVREADSEAALKESSYWWNEVLPSRLNNQESGVFIVIMQRTNEKDMSGVILDKQKSQFKHICIPAELSEDVSPPELKKHYIGGLGFPQSLPGFVLEGFKKGGMSSYAYASQYQQRPSPQTGGMLKKYYWNYWVPTLTMSDGKPWSNVIEKDDAGNIVTKIPVLLPETFDDTVQSWDCSFKDLDTNDYVVGQVWSAKDANRYLIDRYKEKMSITKTVAAIEKMKEKHAKSTAVYVEEKANGAAVIQILKDKIPGLIPCDPRALGGNKVARARSIEHAAESGQVYLPHPTYAPWVEDFKDVCAKFPTGAQDDDVDSASQANIKLGELKKVWPIYSGTVDLQIDFSKLDDASSIIFSEWVSKDLSTSLIMSVYNRRTGMFGVFGEIEMERLQPDKMTVLVTQMVRKISKEKIGTVQGLEWIGNPTMFGLGSEYHSEAGGDIRTIYHKYRIFPMQNPKHDETGSIALIALQIFKRKFHVSLSCPELSRQMSSWCFEKGRPQIEGFGLAKALCNAVSNLHETGRWEPPKDGPPKPYSVESTRGLMDMQRAVTGGAVAIKTSGWMV